MKSIRGSKHWLLSLDDCTDNALSFFLKTKDEQIKRLSSFFQDIKAKLGKQTVKYVRCDNTGENIALDQKCQDLGLGITFEYTASNTPQQNGRVEKNLLLFMEEFKQCSSAVV